MSATSSFQCFDVVYFGDYTRSGDGNDRSLEEARMNAELGLTTGFVHVGSKAASGKINEYVLQSAEAGVIATLDPDELVLAKLAIITDPELVLNSRCDLPLRAIADRVLVIADRLISAKHLEFKRERLREIFGDAVFWTATTYDVLSDLRSRGLRTTGTIWESYGYQPVNPDLARHPPESRPIIGTVVPQGQEHWPANEADIGKVWDTRRYVVRMHGPLLPPSLAGEATLTKPSERSQVQFVAGLHAFLYYPSERPAEIPMLAIGTCLANEIPVLLAPELRQVVGNGPRYVAVSDVADILSREVGSQRLDSVTGFDPLEAHQRRLQSWLGGISTCRVRRRRPSRAMLFPSNGEGLGHVNRLISVATRLPDDVEPVFVSLSQAIGLIERAGFRSEMIVSHRYAGLDEAAAYPWMEEELADAIHRYRPDVFVFDGGNPYGFMTNVVAKQRSVKTVWMRRGMWQADQDNAAVLKKRRFFDLVIEPRDIAGELDRGASREDRDGVSMVDPILLLEDDELLSREAAREQLGLNQTELAVLVQLGVGNRIDLSVTQDQVMSHLQAIPGIQIVNLHAPISRFPALPMKGIRNIRGFPVSRYLRAFDFAVSAAGYNSFHELAQCGIPTVFSIRMVQDLDDQLARARYAETAGWGLVVEDSNISELPSMLRSLQDPMVRESMRFNARRSTMANGAAAAAELIAELAR